MAELDDIFDEVADLLLDPSLGGTKMLLRQQATTYDDTLRQEVNSGPQIDTTILARRATFSPLLIAEGLVEVTDIKLLVKNQTGLVMKPKDTIFLGPNDAAKKGRIVTEPIPSIATERAILFEVRLSTVE